MPRWGYRLRPDTTWREREQARKKKQAASWERLKAAAAARVQLPPEGV